MTLHVPLQHSCKVFMWLDEMTEAQSTLAICPRSQVSAVTELKLSGYDFPLPPSLHSS